MHWLVGVGRWVVDVSGPLVGVLVGGYLTLQGQRAADDRQRRARLEDQSRTARLQRVEAQTKAVIDLNVQVTHDIAEFRMGLPRVCLTLTSQVREGLVRGCMSCPSPIPRSSATT